MDRRLLAAVAFIALVGLAGCTTILGGDVSDPEGLSADAEYDFDTDRDGSLVVNRNNYTAVYNVSAKVTGGNETIELYRTDALGIERPLELRGLQFKHPNGTLVRYVDGEPVRMYENGTTEDVDTLGVSNTRQRTTVELPDDEGQLAFTTPKRGKEVAIQTPVHGSYELALPPNTDAAIPLLSQVRPSNDDRGTDGDRVVLKWEEVSTSVIIVQWYLDRDIFLFGGLAVVLLAAGVVGGLYYYLQIQRARERREEEGLGVDMMRNDGDGPPPGMR